MVVDKSKIGLVFNFPGVTRERQEAELRAAGAQWIIQVGKMVPTWQEAVKQVDAGCTVFIVGAPMVPAPRKIVPASRPAQWSSFQSEIHKRGSHIIETRSGLDTRNRKQLLEMNDVTDKLFRKGGNGLPTSGSGAGRPAAKSDDAIKAIWFSRDYSTNEIACKHMPMWESKSGPQSWTPRMCRDRWGVSGRPFAKRKKRAR
jgi:hypothetical protein